VKELNNSTNEKRDWFCSQVSNMNEQLKKVKEHFVKSSQLVLNHAITSESGIVDKQLQQNKASHSIKVNNNEEPNSLKMQIETLKEEKNKIIEEEKLQKNKALEDLMGLAKYCSDLEVYCEYINTKLCDDCKLMLTTYTSDISMQ